MSGEFMFRSNGEEDLMPLTFNEPKRVGNPSTGKWGGLVLTVVNPTNPKLVIVSNEGRFVRDLDTAVELAGFDPGFDGCSVFLKTS